MQDEPFHVPMTRRYCDGDFFYWDPKVTTFPGLYVLGSLYAKIAATLLSWAGATQEIVCSTPFLRSLNALLSTGCYQLMHAVYSLSHSHQLLLWPTAASWTAAATASLPTHLFFAFLYYTDVAALLFLLLVQVFLLQHKPHAAAAAGAAAIAMRQTNAVWVTFLVGAAMLRDLGVGPPVPAGQGSKATPAAAAARPGQRRQLAGQQTSATAGPPPSNFWWGCCTELSAALLQLAVQWPRLLQRYWRCLLLPTGFIAFVVWNKGITLGDREAHAPVTHLMQPLYFAAFSLAAAGPLLASPATINGLCRQLRTSPALVGALAAAAAAAFVYCVQRHSLAHPYLLADNRHYTFYLWRRLLSRTAVRYALVPVYVAAWSLILQGLAQTQSHLWALAFAATTVVTLAPAWLLEFRYFTPPLVLALLHMPTPTARVAKTMTAAYLGMTATLLYIFACRPFTWVDGSVARFMW